MRTISGGCGHRSFRLFKFFQVGRGHEAWQFRGGICLPHSEVCDEEDGLPGQPAVGQPAPANQPTFSYKYRASFQS